MLHANIYQKKVHLTKECIRMTDKGIKDAPHHMSSGKCRIKQNELTVQLLKWPKFGALTTANADKDIDQQEISYTVDRDTKQLSDFRKQFRDFLHS